MNYNVVLYIETSQLIYSVNQLEQCSFRFIELPPFIWSLNSSYHEFFKFFTNNLYALNQLCWFIGKEFIYSVPPYKNLYQFSLSKSLTFAWFQNYYCIYTLGVVWIGNPVNKVKNMLKLWFRFWKKWICLISKTNSQLLRKQGYYGTKYSRMDQVKFVEDSLYKFSLSPFLNNCIHLSSLLSSC